ncbi:MAG: TIGR04283 family arsenosugar biosynthesis glycosyltransferase [Gammaproteobacteria bacterium]|nr:TIGR04283 family arsenosugar biosynthesis glycosyltransferase [Gammaproteobacteria bacterium]MBU1654185.1 TIGR04283 family arsenosugar biosynthesis glycosyltransferase [Gammaproteobacteria bacterium]MBU1961813.1 TIGR04283 family arsenosugar biosynthesis glycosyltransferase [Gammaproteobacteria bacterium]
MTPLSIILPVLNEAEGIVPLLEALLPLRRQGCEVLVADGGSVDGTAELALPLADRVITTPRGRARQINAGAALATGAVFWFLHADSRVPPDAGTILLGALRESGRGWGRFDVRLSGRHPLLRLVERMMNLRSRLTGVATGDQGIFVTRRLFERVGGFPDIPLMEDIALSKRLLAQGQPVCLATCLTTSSRRWENGGIGRTILLMWRLRLAYWLGADPATLARRYYPTTKRLLVFAKAPEPGRVKTRLIPALGGEGAARLHHRLLERTLAEATGLPDVETELWSPDPGHPVIVELAAAQGAGVREQRGRDLGERMGHALARGLAGASRAVLIGSDCPNMDRAYLMQAFAALEEAPVVLGPALDGGYVLIGLREACPPGLFRDIPWGSAQVLEISRARLRESGLAWIELPPQRDLDRPEDLHYFPFLNPLLAEQTP